MLHRSHLIVAAGLAVLGSAALIGACGPGNATVQSGDSQLAGVTPTKTTTPQAPTTTPTTRPATTVPSLTTQLAKCKKTASDTTSATVTITKLRSQTTSTVESLPASLTRTINGDRARDLYNTLCRYIVGAPPSGMNGPHSSPQPAQGIYRDGTITFDSDSGHALDTIHLYLSGTPTLYSTARGMAISAAGHQLPTGAAAVHAIRTAFALSNDWLPPQ